MGRQVNLAPDAYEALRRLKREGETFSDTVRRLARGAQGRPAIVGARLHDDPGRELRRIADERRRGSF